MEPWCGQIPHFGHFTTQRVKGAHNILKKFLDRKYTSNFMEVWKALDKSMYKQMMQVIYSMDNNGIKFHKNLPQKMDQLQFKILQQPLSKCREHLEQIRQDHNEETCSQTTTKGMGIPCLHRIKELLVMHGHLPDDFHKHWQLDYDPEPDEEVC